MSCLQDDADETPAARAKLPPQYPFWRLPAERQQDRRRVVKALATIVFFATDVKSPAYGNTGCLQDLVIGLPANMIWLVNM